MDLTGKRFGRLVVIGPAKIKRQYNINVRYWPCVCDCGNFCEIRQDSLTSGNTNSCGCLQKEKAANIGSRTKKHGGYKEKLYYVWNAMKQRCHNPNVLHYKDYGGRGIKVCDEWNNSYEAFRDWPLANGYSEGLSIERINVNGDYEPKNCKWIPLQNQANNTRRSVKIKYNGKEYSISEISKLTGLKKRTIAARYERGWTPKQIIETPLLSS